MEKTKQYMIGKVKCRAGAWSSVGGFYGRIEQEGGYWYLRTKFYDTREEAEIALQQLLDDLGAKPVAEPWHWELNGHRVMQGVEKPHIIFDHSGKDKVGVATFATPLLAKEFLERYATKVYDDEEGGE